jgi:hypothetical protein
MAVTEQNKENSGSNFSSEKGGLNMPSTHSTHQLQTYGMPVSALILSNLDNQIQSFCHKICIAAIAG